MRLDEIVPRIAYDIVVIGAVASVVGLLIAGVPIAFAIAVDGLRRRRFSQLALLMVPVVAAAAWLGLTAILTGIPFSPADDASKLIFFLLWIGFGLGAVAISCVALGVAALRSEIDSTLYKRAINPARLTIAGMVGVAAAIVGWGVALLLSDPYDFWGYNGLLATSTALSWLLIAASAVAATVVALRASRRLRVVEA